MRAAIIIGTELDVVERPTPNPGPKDVVVAVRAAGINAADLLQRQGFYPAPAGWPADIPGIEMAGVVSDVGSEVHLPLLGRRVCAIVGGGGHATHCVVPSEHLIYVPDNVSWPEAGGFAETFTTAHDALVTQGRLQADERVLISGANGGVGTAAIQIAHAIGSHVIAVTRTSEHHEQLRSLGADETVTLDEVTSLAPVNVVLELVGAAHLSRAQEVLAPRARIVVIGVGGGNTVSLDLLRVMSLRASLTGSTLRARSREEKTEVIQRVNEWLVPRWADGELQVPLAKTFDLDDINDGYEYFSSPGKLGKVVVLNDQ
jgi:NADPH:quinone reductase-like Zn-dependent oxidoreductase